MKGQAVVYADGDDVFVAGVVGNGVVGMDADEEDDDAAATVSVSETALRSAFTRLVRVSTNPCIASLPNSRWSAFTQFSNLPSPRPAGRQEMEVSNRSFSCVN